MGTSNVGMRLARLDAVRGAAMLWMAGFHFCFDLNQAGLMHPAQQFLSDPFWTWQRVGIVSLFLLTAGAGQMLATQSGMPIARFWRRWGQVAACALAVSLGSWWMYPASWIHFGVLHGIAVMLLVWHAGRTHWLRLHTGAWAGLILVSWALPLGVKWPALDPAWANWTGLMAHLPVTQDFVPLLPWLGVLLAGACLAREDGRRARPWLAGPVPAWAQPLATLGRWPLSFYMLHQPVLIGLIQLSLLG